MLARLWKRHRTPGTVSAVALGAILAAAAAWWQCRPDAQRTALAAAPRHESTISRAGTRPASVIRLAAADMDEVPADPATTPISPPSAPAPLVAQGVAAPPQVEAAPEPAERISSGAPLVPDISLVAASSTPAAPRPPARLSSNSLVIRDAGDAPEPVHPVEAPAEEGNGAKGAPRSGPTCPFTGEVGFGRIDDPCAGDEACLRDRVHSMHAAHHPRYYQERPFGSYFRSAMNQQICNGLADQMVLYHYDFREGERAAELSLRGKYQLTKFANRLLSCGYPIVVQETPANPALADARRRGVLAALADLDPALANVDDSVLVGRPRPPGLRGVEGQIIDDNNLQQTEARGTLGPGADADESDVSAGAVPTIP